MHPVINDVPPVQATLVMQVALKLLINVVEMIVLKQFLQLMVSP